MLDFNLDILSQLLILKLNCDADQNPGNYAVKKGIASDHIEKHLQGTAIVNCWN